MSEKLGPIHYMMYEKIKFQDKITDFLMEGDTKEIDNKYEPVSKESLENLIDQDNIHGRLSSKIDVVENRLAEAFKKANDPEDKMYEFGKINSKGKNFNDYNAIFSELNTMLLDGMPCDKAVNAEIFEGDLYLITNTNLHEKYNTDDIDPKDSLDDICDGGHDHESHETFEIKTDVKPEFKGQNSTYHTNRYKFLKGYFENSPYDVNVVNGINYRIYKR